MGSSYEVDVFPWDCLILAKSCWVYINSQMADAFLDYGAKVFCGVKWADYAGPYMDYAYSSTTKKVGFWGAIADDNTVQVAAENLCSHYNIYYKDWLDRSWSVGNPFIIGGESNYILN